MKMNEITQKILDMLSNPEKPLIPLEIVVKELQDDYSLEDIERTIENCLDNYSIDKVLDYAAKEWNLYDGYPIWHLKKITDNQVDYMKKLSPVDLAILKLLKTKNTKDFGVMKEDDVRRILREQGFSERETEFFWIEDLVDTHFAFDDEGNDAKWCRLIPEYEKTEEYKREEERIQEEYSKKEAFRMYIADVHDLADGIRKAVRESPEGISKNDIIKQLFMDDPEYLKEAFEIATEEGEILAVTLDNGEDGYMLNPEFSEEDW